MQELGDLINGLDWPVWRSTDNGDIFVYHEPKLIRFCLRIGSHLRRPTEVIIAEGQFIRMRHAKEYEAYELTPLDPVNPDGCLYLHHPYQQQQNPLLYNVKAWTPKTPKGWNAALIQQQAGLYAQQAGYGQGIGISGIPVTTVWAGTAGMQLHNYTPSIPITTTALNTIPNTTTTNIANWLNNLFTW